MADIRWIRAAVAAAAVLALSESAAAQQPPIVLKASNVLDGRGGVVAADVIAVDGDPLIDITAVRKVVFVMKGGKTSRTRCRFNGHPSAAVCERLRIGQD